ncbi:MAG: hypothetical protein AAGA81_16580 [Acidobacteriota bacterium]
MSARALLLAVLWTLGSVAAFAEDGPRLSNGKPDLSGTYNIATLTPLERPREFGENLYLTPEQAEEIVAEEQRQIALGAAASDPNRDAPNAGGSAPVGLDESQAEASGAGNVGGYNNFWIDRGDSVVMVDGKFRTSILTDPPNGRRPPPTPERMKFFATLRDFFRPNDGSAYWIDWPAEKPGPYDNPEQRPLPERCLASFTSTVPALPGLYNNYKRIVQTADTVIILNEMVHDPRIVRMNAEHYPADVTMMWGDSVGSWDGDTLVVDTKNFSPSEGFFGNSATLHVIERFTRIDDGTLRYEFTVDDPSRFQAPYTGDYVWPASDDKVYEYACHEGNYALGGILRGARELEKEALQGQ